MASQPRHFRKAPFACSGHSMVANVDARLMFFSWHQRRTAEKKLSEQYAKEVEHDHT